MNDNTSLNARSSPWGLSRKLGASVLTLALFASQVGSAYADITNTATANGTPAGGTLVPPTSSVNVPVALSTPSLTISKSAAAPVDVDGDGVINAGDTITFTYSILNNGNVTITGVTPVDTGPTFAGLTAGTTLGGFNPVSTSNPASLPDDTLLPGETGVWNAVYTLTAVDAYRAAGKAADGLAGSVGGDAVLNSATATGTAAGAVPLPPVTPSVAEVAIPANPKLSIVKTYAITTDGGTTSSADVGDVITYTYTVTNTGNVAISALEIDDVHEGTALVTPPNNETLVGADGPLASASPPVVSSDGTTNDGVYDLIQPGATVTFTYVHIVNQVEFDAG